MLCDYSKKLAKILEIGFFMGLNSFILGIIIFSKSDYNEG